MFVECHTQVPSGLMATISSTRRLGLALLADDGDGEHAAKEDSCKRISGTHNVSAHLLHYSMTEASSSFRTLSGAPHAVSKSFLAQGQDYQEKLTTCHKLQGQVKTLWQAKLGRRQPILPCQRSTCAGIKRSEVSHLDKWIKLIIRCTRPRQHQSKLEVRIAVNSSLPWTSPTPLATATSFSHC